MRFRNGKQNRCLARKRATSRVTWSLKPTGPDALLNVKINHVASRNVVATNLPLVTAAQPVDRKVIGHEKLDQTDLAKAARTVEWMATDRAKAVLDQKLDVIGSNHNAVDQTVDQKVIVPEMLDRIVLVKAAPDQKPDAIELVRPPVVLTAVQKAIVRVKVDLDQRPGVTELARRLVDQIVALMVTAPAMPVLDRAETPDAIAWDRHPVALIVVPMPPASAAVNLNEPAIRVPVQVVTATHELPSTALRKVAAMQPRRRIVQTTDAMLDLGTMEIAAAVTSVRRCIVLILATWDVATARLSGEPRLVGSLDLRIGTSLGTVTTRGRRIATSFVTRITSVVTIAGRHLGITTSGWLPIDQIGATRITASVRRFVTTTIVVTTIADQILAITDHGTAIVAKPA